MSETQGVSVKSRQRVTWSAEERAQWLDLFRGSGKSAAEFCRDNDLSPATLSLWLRQPASSESDTEPGAGFVEVSVPSTPSPPRPATPPVTLYLQRGVRLEIGGGADAAWLDTLELEFELQTWLSPLSDMSAVVMRGVEALSLDRRDNALNIEKVELIERAALQPAENSSEGRRRYRYPMASGGRSTPFLLTPFAEAGNASVGVTMVELGYRTAFPLRGNAMTRP